MNRHGLARAFIALADTVVADFDVIELAHQLMENAVTLLPVDAAAILLPDKSGNFDVLVSSIEHSYLLDLFHLQNEDGPGLLAHRSGESVVVEDLREDIQRWPEFTARAVAYGFLSVHALPLRLHKDRIGALIMLGFQSGRMTDTDYAIGQALADVATIGVVNQRIARQSGSLNHQLQTALSSRTTIEQAKGILAERGKVTVDEAFGLLRAHARRTNRRLTEVARAVINGADTTAIFYPG